MKPSSTPTSAGKAADAPLGTTPSSFDPGTVADALSAIRGLLHDFDERGGERALSPESRPAAEQFPESAPAAAEPGEARPGTMADRATAPPDPVPTAPFPAAPPRAVPPRRRPTIAALAVAGLAVIGAAGVGFAGNPGLPFLTVSAAGKKPTGAGNGPEAMARAALPPARGNAVAKSDPAPKPSATIRGEAPRNAGTEAWRSPPAAGAGTAPPVIVLGAGEKPAPTRRGSFGSSGRAVSGGHGGAAAARAPTPAVSREAGPVPAGETRERSRRASLSPHAASGRPAEPSRRGEPFHEQRRSRATAAALAGKARERLRKALPLRHAVPGRAATAGRRSDAFAGGWPVRRSSRRDSTLRTTALSAFARQSRAATPAPGSNAGSSGTPERFTPDRAEYAPPAAARRPVDWDSRSFAPRPWVRTIVRRGVPPYAAPPPPPPRFRRFGFDGGPPFAVRRRPPFFYRGPPGLPPPPP